MKADINEISGNTAEVVLDGEGWFNTVSATIELDEGFYWGLIDCWIEIHEGVKIRSIDLTKYVESIGVERLVNEALSMKYALDKAEALSEEREYNK